MADAKIALTAVDQTRAAFASLGRNLAGAEKDVHGLQGALTGLLAALAIPAAFALFDRLNKEAGNFQDIAEKVGDSAEAFASLNLAAGTAGTNMDAVAQASIKLTQNLTGVDDESQAAGAAITALGLNLADFKKLKPADQMEAVAKALVGFEDGAGKTAVAVALMGKSGAEMLPFLKELGAEGGRQVILTEEQIQLADAYSDQQARLRAQIGLHAQAIASQMLPAYNALSEAFLDVIKDIAGVEEGATSLKNSDAIQEFAKKAVTAIGFVIDAGDGLARVFEIAGKYIGAEAAVIGAVVSGELGQAKTIISEFGADLESVLQRETFGTKLSRRLAEASGVLPSPKTGRPALKFDGAKKDGKDEAAQVAKAQLALDIESIKKASDELVGTYANAEKIMEAVRAAGLMDEREYYAAKRSFMELDAKAKERELEQEIARYRQEKVAGKDKIENDKKIITAESALAVLRAKNTADLEVLSIQQEASVKRVAKSFEEARLAAAQYLAVSGKQYQRELAAFGRGDAARNKAGAFNQIDDRYQDQRGELEKQKSLLEFEGKFTDDQRQQYETRLAIINQFHDLALTQWEDYYAQLVVQQGNWENGANRALENYLEGTKNVAEQTEQLFTKAFGGMEDALVDFVKTGKLDFKSLADSIVADITRIVVRQQIMGPLLNMISGGGGGLTTGDFARMDRGQTPAVGGGLLSGFGNWLSGLFSFDTGTDFVPYDMVAKIHKGERIVPAAENARGGRSGAVSINQNFAISGTTDRRSQAQIAAAAMAGAQRALDRNS